MDKKTPIIAVSAIAAVAAGVFGVASQRPDWLPFMAPAPQTQEQPQQQAAAAPQADAPATPEAPAAEQQQAALPADTQQPAAAEPAQSAPQAVQEQLAPPVAPAGPVPPSFDTVRVEPTGEAVIAGRAAPGADVIIKFDNVYVGEVKAESDGSFVFVPEHPLPQGSGALTLESTHEGQTLVSKDAIAVVVTRNAPALVAKVDPQQPTKIVQAPGSEATAGAPKEVRLSSIDYNDAGNMVFQGVAKPNATVRFYVDNSIVGEVAADAKGSWLFDAAEAIAPGQHTLRADEVDGGGKVTSRAETPFLREAPEKVIASQQAQPAPEAQVAAAEPAQEPVAEQPAMTTEEPAAVPQAQEQAAAPDAASAPLDAAPADAAPADAAAAEPQPAEPPKKLAMAPAAVPGGPMRVVIQPGNNLWIISQELYGQGKSFTVIFDANRDQIKDPDKIYPGQILTTPVAQN
ncbi:MAG: LysM peptidoglycan-binding domain-containing protein [Proteobacteria bacterium]|nr:LysM peptidoglycan-binding domain-containing protein [Pseudomonadota bacterium]